ncbi:hypothetical protein [Mariniphaga sediminis]|uniref:hypothetical protein n=1 Tax=Mariniphaga sediminis TaxID=1628158 RepID=UPI0015584AB7|nr:hypothetical protein [Mariniphaga sediminis]
MLTTEKDPPQRNFWWSQQELSGPCATVQNNAPAIASIYPNNDSDSDENDP